jgi:5-methylcytosine-specific restriction endonuclease McrA
MPKKKVKKKVKLTLREQNVIKECKRIISKHPKLKRKKLNKMKDIDKRLYYIKVWAITESQPLHKLKFSKKRGWRKYHLDHICSISVGYSENIPPEVIGHIDNLRFIHWKRNIEKGSKVTTYRLQETKKKARKHKEK